MGNVGLVYYADDPSKTVFRKVFLLPGETEAEFDDPHWITMGCDPARQAVLIKVPEEELAKYAGWPKVGWEPAPDDAIAAMLDLAELKSDDLLIDLGCGDGRVLVAAAQRGAYAIGIELDRTKFDEAVANTAELPKISVRHENLFLTDLSEATVVTLHIGGLAASAVALQTVKPGTRIVAYNSPVGELTPSRIVTVMKGTVELYVMA